MSQHLALSVIMIMLSCMPRAVSEEKLFYDGTLLLTRNVFSVENSEMQKIDIRLNGQDVGSLLLSPAKYRYLLFLDDLSGIRCFSVDQGGLGFFVVLMSPEIPKNYIYVLVTRPACEFWGVISKGDLSGTDNESSVPREYRRFVLDELGIQRILQLKPVQR